MVMMRRAPATASRFVLFIWPASWALTHNARWLWGTTPTTAWRFVLFIWSASWALTHNARWLWAQHQQPHGGWSCCRAALRAKRATLPGQCRQEARPKALVFLHLNHRFLRKSSFSINTHAIISLLSHVSRMLQKSIGNSDGSAFVPIIHPPHPYPLTTNP